MLVGSASRPTAADDGCNANSVRTSATPRSSDGRDAGWDQSAAFSDDSVTSKASLSTVRHATDPLSTLFQYFCLLCNYHGVAYIPAFWAALLAAPSRSPSAQASATNLSTHDESNEPGEAASFFSSTTTLDFTNCYVGPALLLGFADLCRVHRVALAPRHLQYHNRQLTAAAITSAVVVTAVAPLWSSSAAPASNESSVECACSLLPQLRTLRLVHLSLSFVCSEAGGTAATAAAEQCQTQDGNKVLLYVLEALQGHPRLQLLDLSGNPIASALVPTLSRLVQTTPSLTVLVLDNTLLFEDEIEMLSAQCRLNQLRQERGKGCPASLPALSATAQAGWSAQIFSEVQRALDVGVSAVPWLLGKSTVYVRRYHGQDGLASFAGSVRRKSASSTTIDCATASSRSVLPSLPLRPDGGDSGVAYLCYDAADVVGSPASPAATRKADGSSAAPASTIWTPECTEVVRTAFLDRQLARQRVLGGRSVWPNMPLPEEAEATDVDADFDSAPSCRPTIADLSCSAFLRSICQQLLPRPQAPPGMRHDADAAFLTTAEENYWTVRQTQEKQWGYLVGRLAEMLVPLRLRDNEVLYAEGEACSSYVYFLPADLAASQTWVTLHAGDAESRVLPGEWVGEAEALGCLALYPSTAAMATPSFARHSTARLTTSSREGVTVWVLPFSVAFFYLYVPYQQLQQQFMQRTPMSSFAHIHPVHLASVPVRQELFHWTRSTTTATQRQAATATTVFCTADYLTRHVVLLVEGEYMLRVPLSSATAALAEVEERHLLSGNVIATQATLALDGDARAADCASGMAHSFVVSAASEGSRGLGKAAALRQFRRRKAAARQQHANASGAAAEGAETGSEGTGAVDAAVQREAVELRPYPSSAPVAHWRYAGISNEAFAALCQPLRLALTRHCCVLPQGKA